METVDDSRLRGKITLRLVAPLALMFVMNSLDRVNVSFAALQMNAQLHFSPETYGLGASIFFFGYILLQAPHALSARWLGARVWIFLTMLVWGLLACAMAFVHDRTQFFVLRFLLGCAEGGFAPGAMHYLASWVPKRFRAWVTAGTMVAIPVSVVIGAPLSGWLLQIANPIGMAGWRWMFLIEGLPPVLLSVLALKIFVERPEDAGWLTPAEKTNLRRELDQDRAEAESVGGSKLVVALANPRVWASMVVWFCILAGSYGLMFWLPQVIKESFHGSELMVGVLSALPWLGIGTGMMVNAWHSDRTGERFWHLGVPAMLSALCIAGAALISGAPALLLLTLGGFFLGSAQGCFWPIPLRMLTGLGAAAGITFINMCGNSAGMVAPVAVGWVRAQTGSFQAPVFAMASLMLVAALMMIPLSRLARADQTVSLDQAMRPAE